MRIRLNRAHYPVTTLGPGRRIGLWLQGCSIGCAGCLARDTWDRRAGTLLEIEDVVTWCDQVSGGVVDGVTISGGEPFEQPRALACLLEQFDVWRHGLDRPVDLLCYSGMPLARLQREYASILERLDALVPEPFVRSRPRGESWQGSDNQPLVLLSALGRARYDEDEAGRRHPGRVQVAVQAGRVYVIGIPDRGDLEAITDAVERAGFIMEDASWQT